MHQLLLSKLVMLKVLRIKTTLIIFLLPSLVFSGHSFSQSWQSVAVSNAGAEYFIDMSSLARTGTEVTFILLANHPEGFQYGSHSVLSLKTFRSTNCESNSYKFGYVIGYKKLNGLGGIEMIDHNKNIRWIQVKPHTMVSYVQEKVCKLMA